MHHSLIFFHLHGGRIDCIPQQSYVQLVRGVIPMPEYASCAVRIADWYVQLRDGIPDRLDNETYTVLKLDNQGYVDWNATLGLVATDRSPTHAVEQSATVDPHGGLPFDASHLLRQKMLTWLPSDHDKAQMRAVAFLGNS